MKPAAFDYAAAADCAAAVALLAQAGTGAKPLAGGQSLGPLLNLRLVRPTALIDLSRAADMRGARDEGEAIIYGAGVTHAEIEDGAVPDATPGWMAAVARRIAYRAVRNRGTIGGSLALADPAAELPACLLALGGEVEARGPRGTRRIAAEEFFKGLFETALAPDEMLTAVRVPAAGRDTRVGFAELSRRHGDYALVGLAASARVDGGRLADVRLAFFGVGATPLRARGAEAALVDGDVEAAVNALDLDPPDDAQATGAVKRHLAGVLLRRVARQLREAHA